MTKIDVSKKRDQLCKKYPQMTLNLSSVAVPETDSKIVTINYISMSSDQRGQGTGSKVLKELCKWADKNNVTLALTPVDYLGTSQNQLIRWYKRFDFKLNKGKKRDFRVSEYMIRTPKIVKTP